VRTASRKRYSRGVEVVRQAALQADRGGADGLVVLGEYLETVITR